MGWTLSSRSLTDEGLFFQELGLGKLFIKIDPARLGCYKIVIR
jgi:hypothetical protein